MFSRVNATIPHMTPIKTAIPGCCFVASNIFMTHELTEIKVRNPLITPRPPESASISVDPISKSKSNPPMSESKSRSIRMPPAIIDTHVSIESSS